MKTTTITKRFIADQTGANLVEYIMLVGLIAIIAFAGFKLFGGNVKNVVNSQAGVVNAVPTST